MTDGLKWQIQQCVATRLLLPCALDHNLVPQNILALKGPCVCLYVVLVPMGIKCKTMAHECTRIIYNLIPILTYLHDARIQ